MHGSSTLPDELIGVASRDAKYLTGLLEMSVIRRGGASSSIEAMAY